MWLMWHKLHEYLVTLHFSAAQLNVTIVVQMILGKMLKIHEGRVAAHLNVTTVVWTFENI